MISLDAVKNENNMLDSFSSRSVLQLDQQRGDVWTTNSVLETPSVYCRGCGSAVEHSSCMPQAVGSIPSPKGAGGTEHTSLSAACMTYGKTFSSQCSW